MKTTWNYFTAHPALSVGCLRNAITSLNDWDLTLHSLAHSVHVGEKIAITHKNISTNESSSVALSEWNLDPASWGEDPLVWHHSVSYKKKNYFESKEFWLEKILIQLILKDERAPRASVLWKTICPKVLEKEPGIKFTLPTLVIRNYVLEP